MSRGSGAGAKSGPAGAAGGAANPAPADSTADSAADATATLVFEWPLDLRRTLRPIQHSPQDPTIRLLGDGAWLTRRTIDGPATLRLRSLAGAAATVRADAWGPGATAALAAVPALVGALDRPDELVAVHPLVRELTHRFAGFRMTRTGQLMPALVPAVLGQKITADEMIRAWIRLLRRLGEPAPGPGAALGLVVLPSGRRIAALPYFDFHPMGVERRRAELLRRLAAHESEIEGLMALAPDEASVRLQKIPGIGPWTAAEATRLAFGDADAVSVGDAHIPDMVAWALAGEPRASDARMLEILEPYRGQRGRVVALLEAAGARAPRYGPRFTPGNIERL